VVGLDLDPRPSREPDERRNERKSLAGSTKKFSDELPFADAFFDLVAACFTLAVAKLWFLYRLLWDRTIAAFLHKRESRCLVS
jgi:hypothetical protein